MDDSLTVSGGGSTAVATDALYADAARLGGTEAIVADWSERVRVIGDGLRELALTEPAAGPSGVFSADWGVAAARTRLREAEGSAGWLRRSLIESAERYGATERAVDALWCVGGSHLAWLIGAAAPIWVGGVVLAGAAEVGARAIGWRTPLSGWLGDERRLLSDPGFVRAVRTAADSTDEALAGLFRIPGAPAIGAAFGSSIGAPAAATVLLGAAGALGAVTGSRVLVDGPVRVVRSMPDGRSDQSVGPRSARAPEHPVEGPVTAPRGIGELVERIPTADAGAQIRVERYGDAADPRWIVYIGGTVDLGLTAGVETNDMTNNLHGIADDSALAELRITGADSGAGERAVRLALAEAGARAGDPIIPVGHSGGGIVAAGLAGDPALNVVAAVSVGGPVASAELREGVPLLSVEHEEDLVPATGGWGHPSADRLTVSRSVLESGEEYASALPAHELVRYRETAKLIDSAEEERLVAFRERVADFTGDGAGDGTGEMTRWIGLREVSRSTTDEPRGR
ncbi:hypothetical protein [Agromyces badenianii]|uniref:hypothetical protein n=1 Tax=Agromyces badenianii TaxID=2080742 RepID=UPI000D58EA83|nr:hypothetical protein [Agromyces badenianii]PWC05569.1 hypothetical protein DCE94_04710 [Agromyces badenianii]